MRSKIKIFLAASLIFMILAMPAESNIDKKENTHEIYIGAAVEENDHVSKSKIIDKRIETGIYSLYKDQLPSGEFPALNSFSPDMSNGTNVTTVFETAFILHTLSIVDNDNTRGMVQDIKNRAVAFLLENREQQGVWRFKGKNQPFYPPDTDDTSIVFSAIVENGIDISNETLDYMLNYTTSDGVFYTWINSDEWLSSSHPYYDIFKMNSIDANVNADVLYAYSLKGRSQAGIVKYLNGIAKSKSFLNGTLYYPSPYVFTYLVTKAYADGDVKELEPSVDNIRDFILTTQRQDAGWGNDMDTAMAAVSLMNIGYEGKPLDKAMKHILKTQNKNGSWSIYSIYIAPLSPPIYYGSKDLTTSFNLEALIKYKKMMALNSVENDIHRWKMLAGVYTRPDI